MVTVSKKEILLNIANSPEIQEHQCLSFELYDNFFIDRIRKNPEPKLWHPEGFTGKHIEMVFEQVVTQFGIYQTAFNLASEDFLVLKYAALFHDAWKPECLVYHADGNPGSPGHAELAATQLSRFVHELNELSVTQQSDLLTLVEYHMGFRKIQKASPTEQSHFFTQVNPNLMCFFGACDLAGREKAPIDAIFEQALFCYQNVSTLIET